MSTTGCGAPDTGCGTPDTGCGTPETGCGTPDTGCGTPETGCGTPDTGWGGAETGRGAAGTGWYSTPSARNSFSGAGPASAAYATQGAAAEKSAYVIGGPSGDWASAFATSANASRQPGAAATVASRTATLTNRPCSSMAAQALPTGEPPSKWVNL